MPFSFDRTISGHLILAIATVIVSVTAAGIANRERTFANTDAIAELKVEIDALEARVRTLEIKTLP